MKPLRVGISTCPNDTFAFHGLLTGAVEARGLALDFVLADVQELNELAAAGQLDVAKVSYAAALDLAPRWTMLAAGSALGFGVGPVVLGRPGERAAAPRVLCPGEQTTATLLWRLFHPEFTGELEQVVFSAIVPALVEGRADLGVCIHEGRFTYRDQGLELVEDLGAVWERATDLPLPLGGIAARTDLGEDTLSALAGAVRHSIEFARADPDGALPTMREHAQEFDDDVLRQHVELYVNPWTVDLGERGRAAIAELSRRAAQLEPGRAPLAVVG